MNEAKVWYAGRVRQEELDEIDRCDLCERLKDIMPALPKTCYATEYCHRQMKMELGEKPGEDGYERERGQGLRAGL